VKIELGKTTLSGTVIAPPSKSMAHRAFICSALAELLSGEKSTLTGISEKFLSEDLKATMAAMKNLKNKKEIFCNESGSTLRFIVPVAAALGGEYTFSGSGRLVMRPISAYIDIFNEQRIYNKTTNGGLPLSIKGKLKSDHFKIAGNVSSQYISGLMFALPLLDGDSVLELTTVLESRPYVDLTIEVLKIFGIIIEEGRAENGNTCFHIKGNQKYKSTDYEIEGDYSQAAFWEGARYLGMNLDIQGLNQSSKQGDRLIMDISKDFSNRQGEDFVIDASNVPDLVPIITVMAAFNSGKTEIVNAARLRLKESDRLAAISQVINTLGGNVKEQKDGLLITGLERGQNLKGGAEVRSFNDHRIAMAVAVAALRCDEPVILTGAESVNKSYPNFWEVYRGIGGIANELDMG